MFIDFEASCLYLAACRSMTAREEVVSWYGQQFGTVDEVFYVDDMMTAQKYRDENLLSYVVPIVQAQDLTSRQDNVTPHRGRIAFKFF